MPEFEYKIIDVRQSLIEDCLECLVFARYVGQKAYYFVCDISLEFLRDYNSAEREMDAFMQRRLKRLEAKCLKSNT